MLSIEMNDIHTSGFTIEFSFIIIYERSVVIHQRIVAIVKTGIAYFMGIQKITAREIIVTSRCLGILIIKITYPITCLSENRRKEYVALRIILTITTLQTEHVFHHIVGTIRRRNNIFENR